MVHPAGGKASQALAAEARNMRSGSGQVMVGRIREEEGSHQAERRLSRLALGKEGGSHGYTGVDHVLWTPPG